MNRFSIVVVLIGGVILMSPVISSADDEKVTYVAESYDPERDAFDDLDSAMAMAAKEEKRILLVVGGNWCPWCRAMSAFLKQNETVKSVLSGSYVVMKVVVSDEKSNTAFLNPYPAIDTYPHLYILSPSGELVHSQSGETLQKASPGYEEDAFAAMLRKHATP